MKLRYHKKDRGQQIRVKRVASEEGKYPCIYMIRVSSNRQLSTDTIKFRQDLVH